MSLLQHVTTSHPRRQTLGPQCNLGIPLRCMLFKEKKNTQNGLFSFVLTISSIDTSQDIMERHFQFVVADCLLVPYQVRVQVSAFLAWSFVYFCGMHKLMLPLYVGPNQRCQRPCPNAALQTWLPVLPKNTPAKDKMFFISVFCYFFCAFLTCLYFMKQPDFFQCIFIEQSLRPLLGINDGKNGCNLLLLLVLFIVVIIIAII